MVLASHQFRRASAMDSGPLSLRMNHGAKKRLVSSCSTASKSLAVQHLRTRGPAKAPLLIDHNQELESMAICRYAELEINHPHLMGIIRPVTPQRVVVGPRPYSLAMSGTLQAFLPPKTCNRLWFSVLESAVAAVGPSVGPSESAPLRSHVGDS
jgi:hypothetical protein